MTPRSSVVSLCALFLLMASAAPSAPAADDLTTWKSHRQIRFDTTASGANVAGEVENFPVAVALTADNFDFSAAKPDGADVRLSAERDGKPLSHSIEHWSAEEKSALVWVKVDRVAGNSKEQSIYLHWGNADAEDAGDSAKVFDTEEGFVGVWHLADAGTSDEGGYKDSTANEAHGTGVNISSDSQVDGLVGKALEVRHAKNQWVKVDGEKRKLFDITDRLTFSIWAKAHSYANQGDPARRALPGYETMFAKGDNSWRMQKFGIRSWHNPPAELVEMCVERDPRGDLCVIGKTDMAIGKWYHLVGVHDHPQAKIYVNGVLEQTSTFNVPWASGDHPVGIGNQSQFPEQGRAWDGVLDEARVIGAVKSDDWIKLDYESQREGQKFLSFGEMQQR